MLIAPLATYLCHRLSHRFVLNVGTLLEALSLIASSFVKANWQLFLSQGACFGFGMGLCFCGSVGITSHWFKKRRSLVNGIASSGSGIGGLVYSLAVGKMIPEFGFPWAMRTLGILCFVINLTCANLLRIPSYSAIAAKASPFRLSIILRLDYLLLLGWAFLSALGYVVLLFSLPSFSIAIGLTQQQGSLASALLNLGQAIGRPAVGLLSDHYGRVHVALIASLLTGILSLVLWTFVESLGLTYFFSIAVGLFAGTLLAAAAPLAAEVVGLQDLGTALGMLWFILCPPTTVAEAIALQLRGSSTESKSYLRVQLFVGFMYIGSALCLAFLWFELRRKRTLALS
jgi:MFS family permease